MLECASSSRIESMLRNMVRSSGAVSTVVLAPAWMRAMSCTGTGSIRSISPESKAATRVESELMVWNTTSSRLCSTSPHQRGLGRNTVFTPGSWLATMNGPVPLALSAKGLSARAVAGCALAGAVGFRPSLRDDEPRLPLVVQDRIGRGEHEVDRVIVDLLDLGIGWDAGLQLRAGPARAFHREHHVVGREGRAVVESHALAQVEAPAGRVQHLPALGEAWDDLEVLVAPDQAFHHVGEQAERDRLVERVGVERVEAPLESHSGLRLALRCRAEHGVACQTGGKPGDEQKSKSQGSSCGHGWGALAMVCGTNGKLGKNW